MPAVAVVGFSNCGKTTLICRLLTLARRRGWRWAAVKHSHKALDPEQPGKDTWRFRQAGAAAVALACPGLIQVIEPRESDPDIAAVLAFLPPHLDLVLVEGYKHSSLPKLVFLPTAPASPSLPAAGDILAYISDTCRMASVPSFSRDDAPAILDFLWQWLSRR